MAELTMTEADHSALSKMPDEGWFQSFDVTYQIRCPDYRCKRLVERGFLEDRVVGEYPHLQREYRKLPEGINDTN